MNVVRCGYFALGAKGTSFALAGVVGYYRSMRYGVYVLGGCNACSLGMSRPEVQGVQRNHGDSSKSEDLEYTLVVHTRDLPQR